MFDFYADFQFTTWIKVTDFEGKFNTLFKESSSLHGCMLPQPASERPVSCIACSLVSLCGQQHLVVANTLELGLLRVVCLVSSFGAELHHS